MQFESLKIYARNHNTPLVYSLLAALPFVAARLWLYGLPHPLLDITVNTERTAGFLAMALVGMLRLKKTYAHIAALEGRDAPYGRLLAAIIVNKLVYMTCWLMFLFWPVQSPLLFDHLVGYAFILSAAAMYASISAPHKGLFFFDVGLQACFAIFVMVLNKDQPEMRYAAPLVVMFLVYTLLIGNKITQTTKELLRTQTDLERSARAADKANRAKSEFLAMMSHEIRTPMAGVLGMVDYLKETPLQNDQQQSLETISECSKTLLNTLNDVLDISRMEAGKLNISRANFDFHGVLMNSFKILKPYADKKRISLELKVDPAVPQHAYGDPSRIQQIIFNLVNNAIKFTHEGGVTMSASFADEMLHVEIRDTGIGMSDENMKRLFKKFSQADGSISRRYGGSGLGLSIAKQLIELMGGTINASSKKGLGSVFSIALPYKHAVSEKLAAPEAQSYMDIPPQRVLLVEDNEVNQTIVTRMLAKKGHSVAVAVEGQTAIAMVQSNDYDIILMDCSLPGISGIETTQAIKNLGRKYAALPVIALTANGMAENIAACHAAGMVDAVIKPFPSSQLYLAMARALRKGDFKPTAASAAAPVLAEDEFAPPPETLNVALKTAYEEFGPDYTIKLVTRSVTETVRLIRGLEDGLAAQDYALVQKSAHDLKGIAGYIGLNQVQDAATEIEKHCVQKNLGPIPALIQTISRIVRTDIAEVEDAVKQVKV